MRAFSKTLYFSLIIGLSLISVSCNKDSDGVIVNDLNVLPPDSGGEHIPEYLDPDKNIYGHYTYIPGGYTDDGPEYPLIVFLHGSGEKGNSEVDRGVLSKINRNGIPKLIESGQWNPSFPAIVVSPQCHDGWWDATKIHEHIEYLAGKYNINKKRIYVTGLSMGGFGTFSYLETYGDEGYAAAVVPICGGGNINNASSFSNIPVWAFHGEADSTVMSTKSIEMISAINELSPTFKAKLTIYPGVGHNSWSMTYDGTGMGKESKNYDPFDEDIFSWMFRHSKDSPSF